LRNKRTGTELPMVLLPPANFSGQAVIWLTEQGKAGLFTEDGTPKAEVKQLLDAGAVVLGVDLLLQGEFNSTNMDLGKNRPVKNSREFAGYTYGYNLALLAQRAHDVMNVIAFAKHHPPAEKKISLIADRATAPVAAAALAMSSGTVDRAALDIGGFRFLALTDYLDANFLPGAAKYGDLPGLLSLAAPTKLWLAGETDVSLERAKKVYSAAGAIHAIEFASAESEPMARAAVSWILKAK
jgi:hypothetical protein